MNPKYNSATGPFLGGTNIPLLKENDLVTSLTTVSSPPTLQCRLLRRSLLFFNSVPAALLKGNIHCFLRCVPFSAALEISSLTCSITIQFSRFFSLFCSLIIPQSLLLDSLSPVSFPWLNFPSFSQTTFSFSLSTPSVKVLPLYK